MKRIAALLMFFAAADSLLAGVTYKFTSSSTGLTARKITGTVRADGPKMRVDFITGDGMLFKNGSRALTTDGGKTLSVVDPPSKSFYELDLAQILAGPDSLFNQFGGMMKFDVRNPKVSVRDRGNGGTVAGYATRKSTVNSSYDLILDTMGQNVMIQMQMATDVWWTDRVGSEFTNFLQMRGLRTGIPAVDTLIESQSSAIKGFPLRQITTTRMVMNGKPMTSTMTSDVSDLRIVPVPAADFVVPVGYTLAPSPFGKILGR